MCEEYDFDYFQEKMLKEEIDNLENDNKVLDRYLNYLSQIEEQKRVKLLLLKESIPKDVSDNIANIVNNISKNNSETMNKIIENHFKRLDLNNDNLSIEVFNECINNLKTFLNSKNNI